MLNIARPLSSTASTSWWPTKVLQKNKFPVAQKAFFPKDQQIQSKTKQNKKISRIFGRTSLTAKSLCYKCLYLQNFPREYIYCNVVCKIIITIRRIIRIIIRVIIKNNKTTDYTLHKKLTAVSVAPKQSFWVVMSRCNSILTQCDVSFWLNLTAEVVLQPVSFGHKQWMEKFPDWQFAVTTSTDWVWQLR